MNNSISNLNTNRTFSSQLLVSQRQNTSASERNAQTSSNPYLKDTSKTSIMERRMSVVNLEAGLSVQNSYSPEKVNQMSLVYRFEQASRSRISTRLLSSAPVLNNLNYLR
jgi:hypothetical protein